MSKRNINTMFFKRKDVPHDRPDEGLHEMPVKNPDERLNMEFDDIKAAVENTAEEIPTISRPAMPKESYAPLFVKIDKYKEILISINELKLFLSGTRQLFTVLNEIETIRADAINIMRANIQRVEKTIMELDNELLRPHGVSMHGLGITTTETRHMEDTLTELQKQLATLRQELHGVR